MKLTQSFPRLLRQQRASDINDSSIFQRRSRATSFIGFVILMHESVTPQVQTPVMDIDEVCLCRDAAKPLMEGPRGSDPMSPPTRII